MRVTFDTNTFDKVSRPSIYPGDPEFDDMVEVHQAFEGGDLAGFICDATITLEGIGGDHRSTVFGGATTHSSIKKTSEDTFTITISPQQPDRRPVHPKQAERFREAFRLGMRLLGAPRIGMPERAEEEFYVVEDPTKLEARLNRFVDLCREIEMRGLGSGREQSPLLLVLLEMHQLCNRGSQVSVKQAILMRRGRSAAPSPNGPMATA